MLSLNDGTDSKSEMKIVYDAVLNGRLPLVTCADG